MFSEMLPGRPARQPRPVQKGKSSSQSPQQHACPAQEELRGRALFVTLLRMARRPSATVPTRRR